MRLKTNSLAIRFAVALMLLFLVNAAYADYVVGQKFTVTEGMKYKTTNGTTGYYAMKFEVINVKPNGYYEVKIYSDTSLSQPGSGSDYRVRELEIPQFVVYNGTSFTITKVGNLKLGGSASNTSGPGYVLNKVILPPTIEVIGEYAFHGCMRIIEVIGADNLRIIERQGFYGCNMLASLPDVANFANVEEIGYLAFYCCDSLRTANLASIKKLGVGSFAGNGEPDYVPYRTEGLTSLVLGEQLEDSIPENCFRNQYRLTSVEIPGGVEKIGKNAFYGCEGLTSVKLHEGLKIIEESAFGSCRGLTSFEIPASVNKIGKSALSFNINTITVHATTPPTLATQSFNHTPTVYVPTGCRSLYLAANEWKKYNIEEFQIVATGISLNAQSIGFTGAGQTATLTATITPSDATNKDVTWTSSDPTVATVSNTGVVTAVANGTAVITATTADGTNLTATCNVTVNIIPPIDFADANVKAICVANWDTSGDGELSEAEAAAVTNLGEVFSGNTTITSFDELQYFTGLTSIGNGAFLFCRNLTSVTIPSSVTSIDAVAFCGSGLTSITIPNSVISIGGEAFGACSGLNSVIIPSSVTNIEELAFSSEYLTSIKIETGNTKYDSRNNCNAIIETETNTLILGCKNTLIPNSVTIIDDRAFYGCSGLTSITIPNSVTSIGNEAFIYCYGLTSITIGNNVTSIGNEALLNCDCLTSIIVESGNSIYDSRNNCNAIIETATNTLITGCKNTIIPNSVTIIDDRAFYGCGGLTSINIPDGVTSIGSYAFYDCWHLTSITIPGSVTNIGRAAFGIDDLFGYSLTDVYCYAEAIPHTGDELFNNANIASATLHVPAASLEAYSTTAPWSGFGTIVAIEDDVEKEEQTLSLASLPEMTEGDAAYSLPEQTEEGLALTWSIEDATVASINGYQLTPLKAGTTTVTATQEGNSTYLPFTKTFTLTVNEKQVTQSNAIACAYITARCGQEVELPIQLTNDPDLAIVGISFTLTLPEGVTFKKKANGKPVYALVDSRLDPEDFSVTQELFSDNSIGVRIYTTSPTAVLQGTEGKFMTFTLNIAESMEAGDYDICMTENRLSIRSSGNTVTSAPIGNSVSTLTVNNIIMGDVNNDGEVDLSDAIMVIYYSLHVIPENFITDAADLNNDTEIDLSDAITIIYMSLGVQVSNNAKRPSKAAAGNNDCLLLTGEGKSFGMSLSNEERYLGFQCDITLPEGTTLSSVALSDSRAERHSLMFNQLEDGSYRIVVFSAYGDVLSGNVGELLTFNTEGTAQGEACVKNIFFVNTKLEKRVFEDLSAIATGIQSTFAENGNEPAYDLSGRKIANSKSAKGIYISKNRKTLRK